MFHYKVEFSIFGWFWYLMVGIAIHCCQIRAQLNWMFEPEDNFFAPVKFTVILLIIFFLQCGWFWQHLIVISGFTLVGCLSLRTAQQKIRKGQVKPASMQSFWARSSTRWDLNKAIFYSHILFIIRGYASISFFFRILWTVSLLVLG